MAAGGDPPAWDEVADVIRLTHVPDNFQRGNVRPSGARAVQSVTLGLAAGREPLRHIGLTAITHMYPSLFPLFATFLAAYGTQDLCFSSIQLNKNFACRRHRDQGNAGPSALAAFGTFSRGRLWTWEHDDWCCCLEDLSYAQGALHEVDSLVYFDGRNAHETEPYVGERFSLVFYMSSAAAVMSESTSSKLLAMGAVLPPSTQSL